MSAVRIQSLPIIYVYCQLIWKDDHIEKDAGNGPFKKILPCLKYFGVLRKTCEQLKPKILTLISFVLLKLVDFLLWMQLVVGPVLQNFLSGYNFTQLCQISSWLSVWPNLESFCLLGNKLKILAKNSKALAKILRLWQFLWVYLNVLGLIFIVL